MPYKVVKVGGGYATMNKHTCEIKGHHDSKEKAMAQMRLLYGVEHGMKVKGKKKKK